jgi:hypothetical protein
MSIVSCSDKSATAPDGVVAANASNDAYRNISSVTVSLVPTSVIVGDSATATAVLRDSRGRIVNGTVTWSTSASSVATVSPSGVVRGVTSGMASISAAGGRKTGSATLTVTIPTSTAAVATVTVSLTSTTINPGQTTQGTAIARDASNNILTGRVIVWQSSNTAVATESTSGLSSAIAGGTSQITATSEGKAGGALLTVVAAPPPPPPPTGVLATSDFNDGTFGPYTINEGPPGGQVDVVADPTGAGKGKVARFHYPKVVSDDVNRSLEYHHSNSYGQTLYFRGEFYIPVGSPITDGTYQRKLLYWLPHVDYTKYGTNGSGGPTFWSLVTMFGDGLFWNGVMVAQNSANNIDIMARLATITPGQWYTIEKQITPESSIGAKDGVVRIWLNGNLVFTKTNMQWTDPAWIGQPVPNGNGTPLQASDVYFQRYEVGDQVNYSGTFDEYRYWDNVTFSTARVP